MNKEHILLVDDMPEARDVARRMLTSLGYEVVTARDGAEAIAIVDGGQGFDILVTDISMPDMDGIELAHIVSRRVSNIKVLFTSGLPNTTPDDVAELGARYITKPYRKIELAQVLAELIAS